MLGKGLYKDIPDELTLQAIPTVSELDYVSAEDFKQVMLENILPQAIKEDVDPTQLLDIDYYWVTRCLRLLNYGPYHTVGRVFCSECGVVEGEARVDLRAVECKPLPENFKNDIVISKDELIDFKEDIHLHLLTVREVMNSEKDKMFNIGGKKGNAQFARMCYMINKVGNRTDMNAINAKAMIEDELTPADYQVLKAKVNELTDYGLRAGGVVTCPKCKKREATFLTFIDDKFFRPTLGDIRAGRDHRCIREKKNA